MCAKVDERLKDWNCLAKVLLKELIAAWREAEKGNHENSGWNAIIAIAAVDKEAGDCQNDAERWYEIKSYK
jgi:hypothetical protein